MQYFTEQDEQRSTKSRSQFLDQSLLHEVTRLIVQASVNHTMDTGKAPVVTFSDAALEEYESIWNSVNSQAKQALLQFDEPMFGER